MLMFSMLYKYTYEVFMEISIWQAQAVDSQFLYHKGTFSD